MTGVQNLDTLNSPSPVNLRRHVSVGGAPGRRYGSAEHGGNPARNPRRRGRSRERERDATPSDMSRQMGPQETIDWDTAMDNLLTRVETVENNLRRQAQGLSKRFDDLTTVEAHLRDFAKALLNTRHTSKHPL